MSATNDPEIAPDRVMDDVGGAALRLMAGVVPRKRLLRLRTDIAMRGDAYPWREMTDAILAKMAEAC